MSTISLPHQQIILCREKTPRTSRSVNDLLLEQKGKRHEIRHFHQLFRRLRAEGNPAPARMWDEDEILGTSITCSGIGKSKCWYASTSWSPPCGPGMSRICTMGTTSASCSTDALLDLLLWLPRLTQTGRPGCSSNSLKSSGWKVGSQRTWPGSASRTHLPTLSFL